MWDIPGQMHCSNSFFEESVYNPDDSYFFLLFLFTPLARTQLPWLRDSQCGYAAGENCRPVPPCAAIWPAAKQTAIVARDAVYIACVWGAAQVTKAIYDITREQGLLVP